MVRITGNTYPVRQQLRAMGGQFVERTRLWWVPDERADEARALVAAQPPREPQPGLPWSKAPASAPPGWQPCGAAGCTHLRCDVCEGRGASRWKR